MLKSPPYLQTSLVQDSGHLLVQVPRRSGILWKRRVHKEFGHIAEKMLVEFVESGCPIFRATTPLSKDKLKKQRTRKTVDTTLQPTRKQLRLFRIKLSANHLSLCGAVAKHVWRLWIPSRSIRTTWCGDGTINCPQWNQDRSSFAKKMTQHIKNFLLKRYEERIKSLSHTDRVSKFCMDAGFKCCWNWTVFHDKRKWRTILYKSLSWIHSSKKWRIITTKRMDPKKHKNWTRTGSYDQLPCRVNTELK